MHRVIADFTLAVRSLRKSPALTATALITLALAMLAFASAPWQVYAAYLTMSFGWLGLGLVVIPTLVSRWFTHGPTHGIGIDVHDPLGPTFVAGAAFVIEPGLYIRQAALDELPKTPENVAFIEKVRPAVEKYKNIGVRIEDSFLLTEQGLVMLSAKTPRKVADIEKIVGTGK